MCMGQKELKDKLNKSPKQLPKIIKDKIIYHENKDSLDLIMKSVFS